MLLALALAVVLPTAEPLIPHAVGPSRGGIPIVAVGAPGTPWAVVQLHVRLADGDLAPADRAALDAITAAWAEGAHDRRQRAISEDIAALGGTTTGRVSADALLVSDGAPAEKLNELLRLFDERLRARGRLVPSTKGLEQTKSLEQALDPRAIALAAPGHPIALPTSGRTLEAPALRAALDRLLKRGRVAISVVGPLPPEELLSLVTRTVQAPLPPMQNGVTTLPIALTAGTRLAETAEPDVRGVRSTMWFVGPGLGSDPKERAARSVLARLVGGRTETLDRVQAIAVDVSPSRPSLAARAERERLLMIAAIATTPPPLEAVERERAAERAARLEQVKDSEALASSLGKALLWGDASRVEKEAQALLVVTPEDVANAARAMSAGPKIIYRTLGGAP